MGASFIFEINTQTDWQGRSRGNTQKRQAISPRHSKICQILLFMFPKKGIRGGCKERSESVNP